MPKQLALAREIETSVLGCLIAEPQLFLQKDKYKFEADEFCIGPPRDLYKAIEFMIFMDNAKQGIPQGTLKVTLAARDKMSPAMEEYLQVCLEHQDTENFEYYYTTFKKNGLLKELGAEGYLKQSRDAISSSPVFFNNHGEYEDCRLLSSSQTLDKIKNRINELENKYIIRTDAGESKAADNIRELIAELREEPEIGCPLQGDIFNFVCRGGRLGKLYLRSAQSGVGKTRTMVGDACNLAYPIRFDNALNCWVATGNCEKVLYVMTEQDPEEIKTMVLAYLTGINEEHFLYNTWEDKDSSKVEVALEIMERYRDNLMLAQTPNPSASIIQNLFRRYRQKGVKYFFYDYIFSSPSMLEEYKSMGISESVALRMFTTALKNLATELNVFILTSTQLSMDMDQREGGFKDYHYLRGSKAIQDLTDFACIMSRPSPGELKLLSNMEENIGVTPNLVTDVYKNRRGRWTMIRIWSYINLGICQKQDLFITSPDMSAVPNFQLVQLVPIIEQKYEDEANNYNTKKDIRNGRFENS